jgi:hypothetical protein
MPDFPLHVRAGSGNAGVFARRPDMHAVRQTAGDSTDDAIARIPDGKRTLAVYKGDAPAARAAAEVLPVYSAGPDGPIAVPTGRVFVRFAEGVRADERRDALTALGFEIERTMSYAKNAAWVSSADGGVAHALERLPQLESLPDVMHVEPQLLMERALKRG